MLICPSTFGKVLLGGAVLKLFFSLVFQALILEIVPDPISHVNVNLGCETFCDLKLHGTLVRITTCAETYSPL